MPAETFIVPQKLKHKSKESVEFSFLKIEFQTFQFQPKCFCKISPLRLFWSS